MKRIGLALFITGISCLAAGCVSSGKAAFLANRDTIALVSVVSNGDINWKDEKPLDPKAIGSLVQRTLRSNTDLAVVTNADGIIDTAETIFRESMANSGRISLAEKGLVFSTQAYRDAQLNKHQLSREQVKPGGYQFIDYRDKNFASALAAETGIQYSMYVEFNFIKNMASGISKVGSFRANIDMTVLILNSQGKISYKKTISMPSSSAINVSNGVYSQSELIIALEDTISDICHEFLNKL